MGKLADLLQSRTDGYWQLLATAAGRHDAVSRCLETLSAEALAANTAGPSTSPSMVERRVDSLAAFDSRLLADVSRSWLSPERISSDLLDATADYWAVAWARALRFLVRHGRMPEILVESVPRLVRIEHQILFHPAPPLRIESVRDFLACVTDHKLGYANYRSLDRCVVDLERQLRIEDIRQLLGGLRDGEQPGLIRLRVLLSRPQLVGDDAVAFLCDTFRARWSEGAQQPSHGLLVLLNLLLILQAEPLSEVEEQLVELLHHAESPEPWIHFCYLLLRQGWDVP